MKSNEVMRAPVASTRVRAPRTTAKARAHRGGVARRLLVGAALALLATAAAAQPATAGVGADGDRTIETISAIDKNGSPAPSAKLSADGSRALYVVVGGAPGSSSGQLSVKLAQRDPVLGWRTTDALPGPDSVIDGRYNPGFATADLSQFTMTVVNGVIKLLSPATLVRMDDARHQTVLQEFPQNVNDLQFGAASDDLSHVFIKVPTQFDPDHLPGTENVYDFGSGSPVLVSRLPDGSVPACGVPTDTISGFASQATFAHVSQHWVSSDGTKVFFESQGNDCSGPRELYQRNLASGTTTLVSGPVASGSDLGVDAPGLVRAAADNSWVIYRTASALDALDANADIDLYRWTADGQNTCLTCAVPDAAAMSGPRTAIASEDGARAYFVSQNQLVAGRGAPGADNIYVSHVVGGVRQIDYVAPAIPGTGLTVTPALGADISSDGRMLAFVSNQPAVTTDDNGGFDQYYLYDDGTQSVTCVSCPHGRLPTSSVPTSLSGTTSTSLDVGHALSPDGTRFAFVTTDALAPQDVNGGQDLYEWHDGRIGLITDGIVANQSVAVGDVASDGRDVLFRAQGRLAPGAQDDSTQMYVARIGGGFPASSQVSAECDGEQCQGTPAQPPAIARAGTQAVAGDEAPSAGGGTTGRFALAALGARQRAVLARSGHAVLKVHVPASGTVSATARARIGRRARTVASDSARAHGAGTVSLRLRLSRAARARLAAGHDLRVAIVVRFSGAGGARRLTLVLRAPPPHPRHARHATADGR
jgi:hypothetical protein